MRKLLIPILFVASLVGAQSWNVNVGGLPIQSGGSVPASCSPDGAMFFKTTATKAWYYCTGGVFAAFDTGSGSGSVSAGTVNDLAKYTAATTVGNSLFTDNGTVAQYNGTAFIASQFSGPAGDPDSGFELPPNTTQTLSAAGNVRLININGTFNVSSDSGNYHELVNTVGMQTLTNKTLVNPIFSGVNNQTGTSYTAVLTDENKLVTLNNASAVAVTHRYPATTGFGLGTQYMYRNLGAGLVTITPNSPSTIDGSSSVPLRTGESMILTPNGSLTTNTWYSMRMFNNCMTASGDIIYGGASGVCTALPKGSDGQILKLVSGLPAWSTVAGTGTVTGVLGTSNQINSDGSSTTPTLSLSSTLALPGTLSSATNGAASTPAAMFTGTPFNGTGANSFPLFFISTASPTAASWSTTGTLFGMNVGSGGGAFFLDFRLNGSAPQFSVDTALGSVITTGNVTIGAGRAFIFSTRARLLSPADGVFQMTNAATTGFTRLDFGLTTSSGPALGVSGTTITAQLGDGTAGGTFAESLGGRFACTHGSNATCGVSTLASGTVTVSTTAIAALAAAGAAGDVVALTAQTCTSCGSLSVGTVSAGTSFVINSTNVLDASNVYWEIRHVN